MFAGQAPVKVAGRGACAGTMKVMIDVTESTFAREVLQADVPVLVDFWATWCGPCRALAPQLEKLAAQRPDLKIVKVDIDENPGLAADYDVMSVPTVALVIGGQHVHSLTGAMPAAKLARELEPFLA